MAVKWRKIPYTVLNNDYKWSIPVGNSSLLTLITYLTLILTVVSAVLIAYAIHVNVLGNNQKKD